MSALGLTDRQLTSSVSALTGTTFAAYGCNLRLDHAVSLMSHSCTLTIGQIAEQSGFGTVRQFQRQFKSRFGVSPTDYQASLREA